MIAPAGAASRASHFVLDGSFAESSKTWMTKDKITQTPAWA
jgi:hypothetical protein